MTKKGPVFGPQNVRKSRHANMGLPSSVILVFGIVFGYSIDTAFVDTMRLSSFGICFMVAMNICT